MFIYLYTHMHMRPCVCRAQVSLGQQMVMCVSLGLDTVIYACVCL